MTICSSARLWMVIAVVWLSGSAFSLVKAGEPTAVELLERARQGKSIVGADSSSASGTPVRPVWSVGIGANEIAPLVEFTQYLGEDLKYGPYSGFGFRTWSAGSLNAVVSCFHFGLATRIDDAWQGGIGLEYARAEAAATSGDRRFGASDSNLTPHIWIEVGATRGAAIRAGSSLNAVGGSLHWRF